MNYINLLIATITMAVSCSTKQPLTAKGSPASVNQLKETHRAHGGDLYTEGTYSFTFRKKRYSFKYDKKGGYTYELLHDKEGKRIHDKLINGTFSRTIDGVAATLSDRDQRRGQNGLNSVIYFASLPHKLLDPAVKVSQKPNVDINNKSYNVLQVTFEEEGGGDDHDDTYYYWINAHDQTIDYLAYNFHTGKGGVRFRRAYNRRLVNGVIFQDYINYKAAKGTPLSSLPAMYDAGQLEKLSVIATENVTHTK